MKKNKQPELKEVIVIGRFDDGKCRQILMLPKTHDAVLSSIITHEKKIVVLDEELEGADGK